MQEFQDIHDWLGAPGSAHHEIIRAESLPSPVFQSEGREYVSFSSNNYLGLSADPRLIEAAKLGLERYGVANCESRLLGGDLDVYRTLEARLASLKGKEAALVFATGFLTNLGVLPALANSDKLMRFYGYKPRRVVRHAYFSDEFNHISIREGIKASGAPRVSYRHCDLDDLEKKLRANHADSKIIVSDGVFSQDGDIVPLPDLLELAGRFDAMVYIDDAHGTGVLGASGGGTSEHFGVNSPRLLSMGTLSKAYGAIGGFVAMDVCMAEVLRFTCPAYGFTSTLPPDQVFALLEALRIAHDEPERRARLWENQRRFVAGVKALGLPMLSEASAIVPVLIGEEARCERFSRAMAEDGIHVDSILFPAVPMGKARLRFNMNACHTSEHLDRVLAALARLAREV